MPKEKKKILFIGTGGAGEPMIKGAIDVLNTLNSEFDIYLTHGSKSDPDILEENLYAFKPGESISKIIPKAYDSIEELLEEVKDDNQEIKFDLVAVSPSNDPEKFEYGKFEKELEKVIIDCGIALDKEDYRFRDVILNWRLIENYAQIAKRQNIQALFDIYTNQTDIFTYLWASITGKVRRTMGDNHIDTHRIRTIGRRLFERYLQDTTGEKHSSKRFTGDIEAISAGYHGGGCVPLLRDFSINKEHPQYSQPAWISEGFYNFLRPWLIGYPKSRKKGTLRLQVEEPFGDVIHGIFQQNSILGMSIFQKITQNGLFDSWKSEIEYEASRLVEGDMGIYIGFGTKILTADNHYCWELTNPPEGNINNWAARDFIETYFKIHRLIDRLKDEGFIPNYVELNPEEEKRFENAKPNPIESKEGKQIVYNIYTGNGEVSLDGDQIPEGLEALFNGGVKTEKRKSPIIDKFFLFAPSDEVTDRVNRYEIVIHEDPSDIATVLEPVESFEVPDSVFLLCDGRNLFSVVEEYDTTERRNTNLLYMTDLQTKKPTLVSANGSPLSDHKYSTLKEMGGYIFIPCEDVSDTGVIVVNSNNLENMVRLKCSKKIPIDSVSVNKRKENFIVSGLTKEGIHVWKYDPSQLIDQDEVAYRSLQSLNTPSNLQALMKTKDSLLYFFSDEEPNVRGKDKIVIKYCSSRAFGLSSNKILVTNNPHLFYVVGPSKKDESLHIYTVLRRGLKTKSQFDLKQSTFEDMDSFLTSGKPKMNSRFISKSDHPFYDLQALNGTLLASSRDQVHMLPANYSKVIKVSVANASLSGPKSYCKV